METTANIFCRIFVDVLAEQGVGTFVCSPGSRNTPLLLAISAREKEQGVRMTEVVVDERSAAFIALGIALTSRRPVALVCTSGSALLNYAPALAEAYYRGIPLIAISADRPRQWIDQEDSQIIRQSGVLSGIVKQSFDFPAYTQEAPEAKWYANRMANDAFLTAMSGRPGPVHVNIALSQPLGVTTSAPLPMQRLICMDRPSPDLPKQLMQELCEEAAGMKILVVAGSMLPDHELSKGVARMAANTNVAVISECLSNLHAHEDVGPADVVLSRLSAEQHQSLRPDLLITFGGALVSARMKQFLRDLPPKAHWSLGEHHNTVDTFRVLSRRIETSPAVFLRQLGGMLRRRKPHGEAANYALMWKGEALRALADRFEAATTAPWSEFKAFHVLSKKLPATANLFLSNGMPVRYADLFSLRGHACYGNRGVSGIEGCTSTAIGASLPYGGMTILVTGDLSMTYDLGALATRLMPERMRIIVIDNGGGGIFRFVSTTRRLSERERFWCADTSLPVEGLAKAFGLGYFEASSEAELHRELPKFLSPQAGASILRIVVDPQSSADTLRHFLKPPKK